jgi:hypothetical protein
LPAPLAFTLPCSGGAVEHVPLPRREEPLPIADDFGIICAGSGLAAASKPPPQKRRRITPGQGRKRGRSQRGLPRNPVEHSDSSASDSDSSDSVPAVAHDKSTVALENFRDPFICKYAAPGRCRLPPTSLEQQTRLLVSRVKH